VDDDFPQGMVEAWQRLLEGDCTLDDVFRSSLCFPLQRRREMDRMISIASSRQPTTVMEIGADKGGGLFAWCKIPTVRRVIACEIRGLPYANLFERAFPHISFLWLPFSSYGSATLSLVGTWLTNNVPRGTGGIDTLFIDGDKSYFDVDFWLYRGLLTQDAVVFMHDITDPSPGAAYRRVLEATGSRHEEIHDQSESFEQAALQEAGRPATCAYENWLRHWGGKSCAVGVIYTGK
jgi:hypothetical protein